MESITITTKVTSLTVNSFLTLKMPDSGDSLLSAVSEEYYFLLFLLS